MIDRNTIESISDELLVLRYRLGADEALSALFRRHNAPVKYYLRRITDRAAADDLAQSVWLEVVKSIGRLRNPVSFRAWLFRIARNKALKSLGHGKDLTGFEDAALDAIAAGDPLEGLDNLDGADVHAGMTRLKPAQREVLTLRFIEGMSYEEIAQVTGAKAGTVRSRIHYAKKALRPILEELRDGR